MKTGIFYGSTTGVTADIARRIARRLGLPESDIHDVARTAPDSLAGYDLIIAGSSTWGNGEVQDDWYDFLDGAQALDLSGKTIAIFGDGDETMSDTFCAAIAVLRRRLANTGAAFTGEFPAAAYSFTSSPALLPDGNMAGLALDNVNHPDLTDARIEKWLETIRPATQDHRK